MRKPIVLGVLAVLVASTALAQPSGVRQRAMAPYRLGLDEMRQEAFDKAEQAFARAVDIDPTFEMAYYMLGRAQMPQKKYASAVTAFTRARDLYGATAGRQFSNAQEAQHYRRDRITEIDDVIRQIQSMPSTFQTQHQIRQLNEQKRLIQESIHRGTDISIGSTVPAYVLLSLGSAYFRQGLLADAEREYRATIAADPKSGEAHNNLAVVYLETGRLDEAERSVQAAEKASFRVPPQLKDEIRNRRKAGTR